MNFGEDKQHILTANKYFSFVFKYRKNLFLVIVECTQHHSITLFGDVGKFSSPLR